MQQVRITVIRNLSLFLQKKRTILGSFLAIAAVMSLYFVFLRKFILQMVREHGIYEREQQLFADRLMVSGLLIIVTVISCFGAIQIARKDQETDIQKERCKNGVDPMSMAVGYWMATALISSCFTLFAFAAYEAYFSYRYGAALSASSFLLGMGVVVVSSILNAGILLGISNFITDSSMFLEIVKRYGALVGFLSASYLPYFFYGGIVRKVLYFLPCTQLTSLMRHICLQDEIGRLHNEMTNFELKGVKQSFGITMEYEGNIVPANSQLAMVILWMAVILVVIRLTTGRSSRAKK